MGVGDVAHVSRGVAKVWMECWRWEKNWVEHGAGRGTEVCPAPQLNEHTSRAVGLYRRRYNTK